MKRPVTSVVAALLAAFVTGCGGSGNAGGEAAGAPPSPQPPVTPSSLARESARKSLAYLALAMDYFHYRFPVYEDVSSAGNHFHAFAKIPNELAPVTVNGSFTDRPHSGATSIRCEFVPLNPNSFGGFFHQNGILRPGQVAPEVNFGDVPEAGINLSGATALTFWARGAKGNEKIEFFVGGVGRHADSGAQITPYPDSTPRHPSRGTIFELTTEWQKFTIDVSGLDLSYVLGGFAWVADAGNNPNGAVFYLDDIQFELGDARKRERLNEPRFLRSYTTLPLQSDPFDANKIDDIDFVLRSTAFAYDNAVAILAFLADDQTDSLRRARLIGDAFIYAAEHDRTFTGGQVRTAYSAGDIALSPGWLPNNRSGTTPAAGFYVESTQTFYEVEQNALDTGNNAWVMIALLALNQRTAEPRYLNAARRIGNFIRTFRNDSGTYQGFLGGVHDPEGASVPRTYASSEHNIDVFAAFSEMFRATGEAAWDADARHARAFVDAMWDPVRGCYMTGTDNPGVRNERSGQLPLDVQAWSVLGLPDVLSIHPQIMDCAERNHRIESEGFFGYDFNEDKDGVWPEGTGQQASAYAVAGLAAPRDIRADLRRVQASAVGGDGMGMVASTRDGLTTGFDTPFGQPFLYYRRLHVGATSWNVFAQLGFNPYYQSVSGN